MALPREPRQKMINIMYLVLTAILALNVSAEILEAFKTVDSSLQTSSSNLGSSTTTTIASLKKQMAEEKTADQAKMWYPKADSVMMYSKVFDTYIDSLKTELRKAAGSKDGVTGFKEDNLEAATRMFEKNGEGKILQQKLLDYKRDILAIDPKIDTAFRTSLPIDAQGIKDKNGKVKDFSLSYFHMTPTVAALTMLSKFQNNVKNAENQVVAFCQSKVGAVEVVYNKFAAVVGQSSNYVMPGEKVTITAGVGAYSTAAQPQITIGGQGVAVNADGVATKDFTAEGGGEKSVVVNVAYTKPDGSKESKPFTIKYTVGTPGGAAVMLDKMNVFYIGVDNPVTIGSPTGWDRTQVTINGGGATITPGTSKRTVRVTTIGTGTINVIANGASTPFPFRVKRIPDPIIKVGASSGGRMQAAAFRAQQFVSAVLENFDFEAHFSVTGATVYFNNPGDRNVKQVTLSGGSLAPAQAYMSTLVPGSTVIFDNIRVVGPDGQTRTIQNPPGFSLF